MWGFDDESTLESFIWKHTMRAADAVAPNLPYPPGERLHVRDTSFLAHRIVAAAGAALRPAAMQIADHSGVSFVRVPPKILGGVKTWRIDGLLTRELFPNWVAVTVGRPGVGGPRQDTMLSVAIRHSPGLGLARRRLARQLPR